MMPVRVLAVASEVYPILKTGGLADVAGALPIALKAHGVEMRTLMPGYPDVMRLLSLTIRLWANIFAGHIIILFMAGGLAVILGLQALGWFALPAGIIIYLFELGLVATLQAFIFATLAAIYIGGAASHH